MVFFSQYLKYFSLLFFKNIYIYLFIFGCVGSPSLCAASRGHSSLWCTGFSLRWLLLLRSTGPRCAGFNSCGMQAQQLWHTGLVAPRHVGSSQTQARTRVPCICRQTLNHCATREVHSLFLLAWFLRRSWMSGLSLLLYR